MKERCIFSETIVDEVTSVEFSREVSTHLLVGTLDGMMTYYDLSQQDEESAVHYCMKIDQPIQRARIINSQFCLLETTVDDIRVIDIQNSFQKPCIPTIVNSIKDETPENQIEQNLEYYINCHIQSPKMINFYIGTQTGQVRVYRINQDDYCDKILTANLSINNEDRINLVQQIGSNYLSISEEGTI